MCSIVNYFWQCKNNSNWSRQKNTLLHVHNFWDHRVGPTADPIFRRNSWQLIKCRKGKRTMAEKRRTHLTGCRMCGFNGQYISLCRDACMPVGRREVYCMAANVATTSTPSLLMVMERSVDCHTPRCMSVNKSDLDARTVSGRPRTTVGHITARRSSREPPTRVFSDRTWIITPCVRGCNSNDFAESTKYDKYAQRLLYADEAPSIFLCHQWHNRYNGAVACFVKTTVHMLICCEAMTH